MQIINSYEIARGIKTVEDRIEYICKNKVLSRQEHYLQMQKDPLFNLIDDNLFS